MYYEQPEPSPQSEIEQEQLDKEQAAIERAEANREEENKSNIYFGVIAELIERQRNRMHFESFPIGTRVMILNAVDLPGYDALAYFPNNPQLLKNGELYYIGYLNRGSWKAIGDIFINPDLLK